VNRRPTPPITADDATKFVLRILRDDRSRAQIRLAWGG
jgi:hypothetical protein